MTKASKKDNKYFFDKYKDIIKRGDEASAKNDLDTLDNLNIETEDLVAEYFGIDAPIDDWSTQQGICLESQMAKEIEEVA